MVNLDKGGTKDFAELTFRKSIEEVKQQQIYCIFETFMTSTCEKKISAEVRLIHAEQISSYNFIVLRKKQLTQLKIKQVEHDILNQWESMGFSKLSYWK